MKKISLLFLISCLFYSGGVAAKESDFWKHDSGNYETKKDFLGAVESGDADAEIFISVVKGRKSRLEEISPSAVANYMEALANDGMLELIPSEYYDNEGINIALDVVFQDPRNIPDNLNVFGDRWLLNAVESGDADAEIFISVVKGRKSRLEEISPSAFANYMEALANDGMLKLIPSKYYDNEDIKIALDVVFQDPTNIPNNWYVFEEHWLLHRICAR